MNITIIAKNMNRVLFTGAKGFLGSNIMSIMYRSGYLISTLDIARADINFNLAQQIPYFSESYNIILHAAGKAHFLPKNEVEARSFFDVNLKGTQNLCAGLEKAGLPHSFIFISTVAVYGCVSGENITESHPLNGTSPYALSKIQAERFLSDWCKRNNVALTILRPSLLAGKNPPGNLGAMINGISTGKYVSIAGGKAQKSIAMADDIGRLIPCCEGKSGIYNLCDDYNPSFRDLERLICKQLNKPLPINIPMLPAKCFAELGKIFHLNIINRDRLNKITQSLTFSNEKIKRELNFVPSDVLTNFVIS